MSHSRPERGGGTLGRGPIDRFLTEALRRSVRAYQLLLAPVLAGQCRFEPSCSRFAEEALARHGWRGGSTLAFRRLLRCHPWGGSGGLDPVP